MHLNERKCPKTLAHLLITSWPAVYARLCAKCKTWNPEQSLHNRIASSADCFIVFQHTNRHSNLCSSTIHECWCIEMFSKYISNWTKKPQKTQLDIKMSIIGIKLKYRNVSVNYKKHLKISIVRKTLSKGKILLDLIENVLVFFFTSKVNRIYMTAYSRKSRSWCFARPIDF